jgi:hypothetical protein
MTTADRPPTGGAPVQPWKPGAAASGGVTCPACGLANEPGARTCRNCGLPIASAADPLRGVAPGRVDLPRARKSGLSATIGLIMVIALLLAGGSLAFSGGGGLLGSGGRLVSDAAPEATGEVVTAGTETDEGGTPVASQAPEAAIKANKPNMDAYVCGPGAIKDLSRGRWFLTDVQAGPRTADEGIEPDGSDFDQVYWRLDRQGDRKVNGANAMTVTMRRATPGEAKERFGDSLDKVQGDTVIIVTFDGPIDITTGYAIEQDVLAAADVEGVRRVQMFEKSGKIHTVIGVKGEPCARLGSTGWGAKSNQENTRVVLDIER